MSTKEEKKARKPITDGIRSKRKKRRARSSEYQTIERKVVKGKVGSFELVESTKLAN